MLSRLGTLIDTLGWRKRYKDFSNGPPSKTRDGIGFYKTTKAQYRYRLTGEGPTIVFLADPPVTIEAYDELVSVFAERYRVLIIEAAGMGFSAANNAYSFGFSESNDDIAALLGDIAPDGSILAFSCVAGLGAVDIAVRFPELVQRLFLLQTTDWDTFLAWADRRDPKGLLRKPIIGQLGMKRLAAKRAPDWLAFATGRQAMVAPLCTCAQDGFRHGMSFSLASTFQRYLAGKNPLGTPTQPTTIIWGTNDPSHKPASVEQCKNIAPQSKVLALPSLGHFPELEDPKRIFQALEEAISDG
jgi:pimeloyl-ACP methyl ester carboxylesterase